MNPIIKTASEQRVRCTAPRKTYSGAKFVCGWEGTEDELETIETHPGRWFEDRHGNPPEPPDYEAVCPECRQWAYIEDVDHDDE